MQRLSLPTADLADFSYKSVYVSLTIDTRKWAVTKRDESRGACRLDGRGIKITYNLAQSGKKN
jgi:hypothetical protein